MQDHSTLIPSSPLSFTQKESYTKRNIGFIKELDSRMKNDINAGRRKLFNSLSTGQMREVPLTNIVHQNQAFFRENGNHRVLQHERSNPDLNNQQQRQVFNQVPQQTDAIINKLVNELNQTKRQRDYLRYQTTSKVQVDVQTLNRANITINQLQQIINQNDSNARQIISKLHQQKEQLRVRNEQMTVTLQNSFKARNDKVTSQVVLSKPCTRCEELDERLRKIEAELRTSNFQYEKEVQKNQALRNQNMVFMSQFQQKYRELQQQLKGSIHQISVLKQEKREFESLIFKFKNSSTVPSEQYENLRIQYENLRQANKILQTHYENLSFHNTQGLSHLNSVTQKIHQILLENEVEYHQDQPREVQRMLSDLQFKCNQYKTWLQETQKQQNLAKQSYENNYRKLELQYSLFKEIFSRDEEHYKKQIEQLTRKLQQKAEQNREKSNSFQANQELLQQIKQLTFANEQLKRQIIQNNTRINQSKLILEKDSNIEIQKDSRMQIEQLQFAQSDLQQVKQLLKQKDETINLINSRFIQTEQLLIEKDTIILQKQRKLEEVQQFMETVLSQQLQQQTNSLNQMLAENQNLKNENSQLKAYIELNPLLQQANKKLLEEIKMISQQYQIVANRNQGLESELMTITTQNDNLRKQIQNREEFMRTVVNQQLQQQTNSLNQMLQENLALKNENYQLKGHIQMNPILQQANKKLIGEIQLLNQHYQMVVGRNRGLQIELMTITGENNKNLQAKRLVELELGDLKKQIESKQSSDSPSKIRYNQQIASLQKQLAETWQEQKKIQDQAYQRYTEEINLLQRRYQQKISNLQFEYKQRLQSETKRLQSEGQSVRHQLEAEFKRKISEKQLSLASLTASSEKYGEILIKYNTLNIDYQTLISQAKQKEQTFQKHVAELEYILANQRREAQGKIRHIEEISRQLQEQNSQTYKNLQNAESYIYELMQKLRYFQESNTRKTDVPLHRQIDLAVEQVRLQLISEFNQEKENIKASFQNQVILRQNQIQQYEIEINHHRTELNQRENTINVLINEMKELRQKMKIEQQEYISKIQILSQQLRTLTQQNNFSATQLSSKNKQIQTLQQTINEQSKRISEYTINQTRQRELQQHIQLVNSQITRKDQQLKQFTTYIEQLRIQNIRLENELKIKLQEIIQLRVCNQQLQTSSKASSRVKDRSGYKQGLNRVEHQLQQSRRQVIGAQNHIKQLEEAIIHAQQQIKNLNSYIVDLQKKSETNSKNESPLKKIQHETEIQDLKNQLQKLNAISLEREQKIISLQRTIAIQSQNEKQKTVKQSTQRVVSQNNLKQAQLAKDLQFFRSKLDEAESYIFYLEKKIKEEKPLIVQQHQSDDEKLKKMTIENQNITNMIRRLQNDNRELQKTLIERDNVLASTQQKAQQWTIQIKTLEKQTENLKQKLSQQISLAKINKNSMAEKVVYLERQMKQSESEWQILLQKNQKAKQKVERQLHSIYGKIRELQSGLAAKQTELQKSKITIQQYVSKVVILNNNLLQIKQNKNNEGANVEALNLKITQQKRAFLAIQQQLNQLKSKFAQKETQVTQLALKIEENEIILKQTQKLLKTRTEEQQFFKNKLAEAQQYIYRLENQQQIQDISAQANQQVITLQKQIILLRAQLEKKGSDPVVSELRQQIQKSKDSIRNLQADRADITTKFKESQSSAEAIQSNLSKAVNQAEIFNIQITRLKEEKQKIQEILSQTKNDLENTEVELQFFRNKLNEAEDYILYLESTKGQDANKSENKISSQQIERLNDQIKDLLHRNKELESEKNNLLVSLSKKSEEIKKITDSLENYQRQFKQALAKIEFLEETKKRSDEKINDFKIQIEKISEQANFFKDKLRQAENYINYFQEERLRQQQIKAQASSIKDKSGQLVATILNLEALIKNLESEKSSILVQLENKQKQNENQQKQINSLKKEKESLLERVTYSQNLLIGNVEKIQYLQNQLREVDQKLAQRQSFPTQQNSEYERLIIKLKQRNTQLEDELQLSYRTIDQLKQSVNQIQKDQKPEQKTFTRSNFTEIPREDDNQQFFKHKLLQAQSYIQQLQKQKTLIEKVLTTSEAKVNKFQSEIQYLNKELLLVASDKKVLESNIVQLNRLNQNLKESLKVAASNSNSAVAIQLSEENNRLKETLLDVQAASRRQVQNLTNKINQLENVIDEYKQKLRVSEQTNGKLTSQIEQSRTLLQNYERKALSAEKQNANLQLIKQDNQELLNALASFGNLKQNTQKLQSKNAELQNRFSEYEFKLNNADKQNAALKGDIDLLKNKLLSSERFIVELQKQLRQKESNIFDEQKVRQQLEKINELQHKSKQIEMKLILSEQKQKRYIQTIQTQQTNLIFFKESLNLAEQEIEVVKRNIDFAEKKTKQDAEIIKVLQTDINKYGKGPQQEAAFFKSKLLQAEAYITNLNKQNKELKEKSTEIKYENLVKEIQSLNEQIQHLHEELVMLESQKKEAEHDQEVMQFKLHQISQQYDNQKVFFDQQISKLKDLLVIQQKKYNDDMEQLRSQLIQSYNQINQLKKQNEKIQEQNDERQEKIETLEAELDSGSQDKDEKYNSQFFKEKLFEAEAFIKELQDENKALKVEISEFNSQVELLSYEISKLKEKQALSLSQSLQRSKIDQKHMQQMKEAEQQLTLVNSQNSELKQKIQAFEDEKGKKSDTVYKVDFLKEKLYEAQSYIVQLEKEIESLTTENIDKEAKIKQMEQTITALNEHVVESESKAHQLQLAIEVNKQLIDQFSQNLSSKQKVQTIAKVKDEEILQLNIKLSLKERQLEQKASEINQIKITLNKESNSLKQKLLQAESYITELERQNQGLNTNVTDLDEKLKQLQIEVQVLQKTILNSDTEKLVLNSQLQNLKEENQQLKSQIQKKQTLLLTGSEEQKQKLFQLLREKEELQSSFSEQKLKINVEIDLARNGLSQKQRILQQTLQVNQTLSAKITELQTRNALLQQEVKVQEKSIENISNSMILKQEKLASIQPLIQKLEQDRNLITELQQQKNNQYSKTTELLDEINRITEQNNTLHEKLQDLERNEQEEAAFAFAENEKLKEDYQIIKKENQVLQDQLNMLTQQLSQKVRQVDHKNQLIAQQQIKKHELKHQIQLIQTQNQELRAKIVALENVQKQFAHFKSVVQEKQAADKELAQIQRDIQQQNLNKSKDKSQSSQLKESNKNKELELSLQQAKKELENELREQSNLVTKEFQREIDNLKNIVSQKEQQTRYLQEQKLKNQQTIKQLEERNHQLSVEREDLEKKQKNIQQLEHALVQAESEKLQFEEDIQKLRNDLLAAFNSSEDYKKQKLKLENEVISLNNEVEIQMASIEIVKQEVKVKQRVNEDLQNNLRNIILEYEGRIQEYNNNINLLNNRLGQSQAKNEQLESKIKSIIIQEQPTEIIVKERESEHNQSEQQVEIDDRNVELQQVREQLILAESQLEMMKNETQEKKLEIEQLKSKIQEKERIICQQNDKLDILMTEQLKQKEQIIREKELIEQDLDLAEKKISQKELQLEGKEEKLGSSIRKLIDITNNYQQDELAGDPTEVLQELQSFPYLNELITSILYRLRLSSAIELEKSLKIQSLKNELELYKSQAQNSSESSEVKKASDALKSQNEKLKADIVKLTQQHQRLVNILSQEPHNQTQKSQPETGNKYAQLVEQLKALHNENDQLKTQLVQLKQVGLGGEKYDELLKQCADYQIHNSELQQQLRQITQAHQKQKQKIREYEQQIQILLSSSQSRDLYQENQSLRQKLTQSQRLISSIRDQDSSGSVNTQQQFKLQFLHLCLNKVDQIENEVRKVESEIQHLSHKEIRYNLPSSSEYKHEDSHLMERLQELEEQLVKNAQNIREHHQKSDAELYILLKDIVNDEQIPAKSKEKIQDYLAQLEQQIVRQYQQHQNEVAILKEQILRNHRQGSGQFSDRSRQNLIREIENLNNAIEIYHQETMRRKRVYKRVLQGLLLDIQHLGQKYETEECNEIAKKIEEAMERNEQQDLEFDGEDFIITGGNGNINVQILEQELEHKEPAQSKNKDTLAMQTEEDKKPFLKFLLSAQDLDKQDLKLLKRKIAELKNRQIEQNLQILKNQEKKLQQVLQLTNKQTSAQQIQNIMVTLANNYSRDEISQIFGSEDNDQLINKLNQALCLEESFYKGLNSSQMMQQIEQRKRKYYQTPTKLSQEVFKHLLGLLSAKKDDEFYEQVDSLFRSMYQIQDGFEVSLRKKDEIYRSHNERMNQIFNRSSSDNSEDYLAEFQRGNMEQVQLQIRSERKPHRSSEGSEYEQSPQRE